MQIFRPLYLKVLSLAKHPHAEWYLTGLSFIEAIFFPIMPEVLLAPMTLANPRKGWRYATLSLLGSMAGAFIGYALGYFAFHLVSPLIAWLGAEQTFAEVKTIAAEQGFWLLLIGGFTPIPFKLLTLASGLVGMPLLPFFAGALIGRGKRVYLVVALVKIGGQRLENALHRYIELFGWLALILLAMLVLFYYYRH